MAAASTSISTSPRSGRRRGRPRKRETVERARRWHLQPVCRRVPARCASRGRRNHATTGSRTVRHRARPLPARRRRSGAQRGDKWRLRRPSCGSRSIMRQRTRRCSFWITRPSPHRGACAGAVTRPSSPAGCVPRVTSHRRGGSAAVPSSAWTKCRAAWQPSVSDSSRLREVVRVAGAESSPQRCTMPVGGGPSSGKEVAELLARARSDLEAGERQRRDHPARQTPR